MTKHESVADRSIRWWGLHAGGVAQFHHPTGPAGHLAGWVMSRRSSNVQRNRWAVGLLAVHPADHVLELGCGPGVALSYLAAEAANGLVVGVDHSRVMVRQARRRNRAAVRAGRVRIVQAAVEGLDLNDEAFDAILAVNTAGMWPDPATRFHELRLLLNPGGRMAVVSQPRCPGATARTTSRAAQELAAQLRAAGFGRLTTELLDLDPPVACVIAYAPDTEPARDSLTDRLASNSLKATMLHACTPDRQ